MTGGSGNALELNPCIVSRSPDEPEDGAVSRSTSATMPIATPTARSLIRYPTPNAGLVIEIVGDPAATEEPHPFGFNSHALASGLAPTIVGLGCVSNGQELLH
jgi:hypothetical protein